MTENGIANPVAQTSKSAVSRVSKPADAAPVRRFADLEIGDTAGLETCATRFCLRPPIQRNIRARLFYGRVVGPAVRDQGLYRRKNWFAGVVAELVTL